MTGVVDFGAIFETLARTGEGEHRTVLGDVEVRLVRLAPGAEGRWDRHDDTAETVVVWSGAFEVGYRDRTDRLGAGQCCVVPAGAEHQGRSPTGAEIVLFKTLSTTG